MTRKLSYQPWQVPPSSVGRALYRKSCPSQDGDPVPGSLPVFCSISCWTLFLIFILLTAYCKVYPLFYTLKLTTCIETLMNLNIITLNHKGFILPSSWSQSALSLEPLPLFIAVLCPPVTYNLKILLSFHGKFPAAQWVVYSLPTMSNWRPASKRRWIWTLLHLTAEFSSNVILSQNRLFLKVFAHLFFAVRSPLVTHKLKIYPPIMASSPQLSG